MYETEETDVSPARLPNLRKSGRRWSTKYAGRWQQGLLSDVEPEQLARALGWFSLGLGLAELLAPRAVPACMEEADAIQR